MTVEELIEELQRQPNKKVPIVVVINSKTGPQWRVDADVVRFDGRAVVIEG